MNILVVGATVRWNVLGVIVNPFVAMLVVHARRAPHRPRPGLIPRAAGAIRRPGLVSAVQATRRQGGKLVGGAGIDDVTVDLKST